MTEWPLLLAGPILRRVDAGSVSVWVALKEERTVQLSVYEFARKATDLATPVATGVADTMPFGQNLHVALVTAVSDEGALVPGHTYSYDLDFDEGHDLLSLGLLTDKDGARPHAALGYQPGWLPGFVTPPADLADLRILHGSCRKTLGKGPDGLAWVDALIDDGDSEVPTRPHQLFLTGDQIYADEIPANLLPTIIAVAHDLMTDAEDVQAGVEYVPVETTAETPAYRPCDAEHFPPGFRQEMMVKQAGFTTTQGNSHLVSFAEYAAMYVLNWSNELWPAIGGQNPPAPLPTFSAIAAAVPTTSPLWSEFFHDATSEHYNQNPILAPMLAALKSTNPTGFEDVAKNTAAGKAIIAGWRGNELKNVPAAAKAGFEKEVSSFQDQYGEWFEKDPVLRKAIQSFHRTLPLVRRALANVPTYMVADDHEVTDDWNVTKAWSARVRNKPLGRTILRNALASNVVFQAWGNDPAYWNSLPNALPRISEFATASTGTASPPQSAGELEMLFGVSPVCEPDLANDDCQVRFAFEVEGQAHKVFALDTRTGRGFDSLRGPTRLLSEAALAAQLDDPLTYDKTRLAVVISPAPTLSPAVVEEFVWPALMRAWDIRHAAGSIPVRGYEAFDAEAWAFNPGGFEAFVGKLAGYGSAVILSGDVHYAAGAVMDYFRQDLPPSRIVQFTSSGFKNPFPDFAVAIIRGLSFTQQLLRFGGVIERLGWPEGTPGTLSIPQGEPVPPHLLSRLRHSPTYLPTRGWPSGTTLHAGNPPHWRWRFTLLTDERDEGQRPEHARLPVTPTAGDPPGPEDYFLAAQRHIKAVGQFTNTRKVSFAANLGLIKFVDGGDTVEQHLYSVHPDHQDDPPQAYAVHRAPLSTPPGTAEPDIFYVKAPGEPVQETQP